MRADLDTFIATLRQHRESRSGPGIYASDKVFALLNALEALQSGSAGEVVAVPTTKLLAIRDALAAGDVPEAYHVLYSIACPGFDSFTPWDELEGRSALATPAKAAGGWMVAETWRRIIDPRHFDILAEAMAEVKATSDGLSDQPIADIVQGCIDEIFALSPSPDGERQEGDGNA